ncbi:autotransporter outer membrane beta-barrel domain-containing protein [Bartonella sp. CL71SXKL]|uniref:autotransporter outer membrane beta-barrel domain-containing protein n=1 Tax=Bartonella sp. CL71SXKL TaxID=3243540 RepID=UPI003857ED4C
MYKTSLLSCTAAAAIILFNIQFTAHAATLGVTNEEKDISGKTYETIYVKDKGKITGSTVTVTGNENTNTDTGSDKYVVTVEGANSALELNGLNIQGTDSDVRFGISVKDGANINLTGGNITASQTGVYIDGSKNSRSILQNVVISDNKNEASSLLGIEINNESLITLENVTVKQAETGILADDVSQVIVSGGSFEGKMDGVYAMGGTTITVDGGTNITSSNGNGLHADDENTTIKMTGGSVTGKDAALYTNDGGHIKVTGGTLTAKGDTTSAPTTEGDNPASNKGTKIESGFGALSQGENSVIELSDTKIKDATIGLKTQESGAIAMTGGSITASKVGAFFLDSKSKENELKDVVTSSGKDDAPLINGIKATNSNVTLNNVTVTQAQTAIDAYDSTVKVLGGSFDAEKAAIFAQNDGNITLTGGAKITSYNDAGLYAEGSKSIIEMTGGSITAKEEAVTTTYGGHITVTDVTLKTNGDGFGVASDDLGSMIELLGKTTISDSAVGLQAQNGGVIKMTGGTITASKAGAGFLNSNSRENKLENVTISSGKDDAPLNFGIKADKSTVTLKDVTVIQAAAGIFADHDSTITISGGLFDAKGATISAQNGSAITLTNGAKITSSGDVGFYAKGSNSSITMIEGNVTGKGNTLAAEDGGHITVTDVTLKTNDSDKSSGVFSNGANSVIELLGKTTISGSAIGLAVQNDGAIKMIGGTITASAAGAGFLNSNSRENKLENVTISSGKDDAPLNFGIKADKSTATLKDVTVTQAAAGIFADHDSTITISGGSFHAQNTTISAQNGSAITLTNNANITSSDNVGLYANSSNSSISMTGGTVTGKGNALVAENGGHITVADVTLKTNDSDKSSGVFSNGKGSVVELLEGATISDSEIGLTTNDGGAIKMTGGTIKTSLVGAVFSSSSNENRLEGVTISSGKDDAPLSLGVIADQNSIVTLKDVTVMQATNALVADDHSTITASGGSFHARNTTISAQNGSAITLTNNANITSSDNVGLYANSSNSTISMTGGTVTGKGNALVAENGGHITVTNVSLNVTDVSVDDEDISSGVFSNGEGSVVELLEGTTISNSEIGLTTNDGGAINMTGGTIKTSLVGASFLNSNSGENKLEGVKISNSKDDALLNFGIKADKSTVVLNNVEVTQAAASIVANDHSTITVSGGSFSGRDVGGSAEASSTIILKNNANITSSDGGGLLADGSGSKIIMMGGSVAASETALFAINGGHIDATDVALKTEGKGNGAFVSGNDSTIQLHGDTIINNTLGGLRAVDGGKITSKDLTIIGGEALDGPDNERTGIWTSDSGSEVRLMGKTTIQNVDEGFYADGGSQIISGDLIITGGESKTMTVGVNVAETDSLIKLNGKTIIQNFDVGLTAENNSTIKMTNGYIGAAENTIKNKIEAKKVALWAAFNGHIDVVNTSMIAGVAGLQFIALSNPDLDYPDDPQKRKSSEINLTNADVHAENGTGIFVGAFTNTNMEDIPGLSIGTVNLKNSEIHADVLLGDGLFEDPKSWKNDNYWNNKEVKAISNGTFTLSADHSTLEGRANISKDRNVRFDLKNKTQWIVKTSATELNADGNLLDIAQRSRSDISTLNLNNSSIIFNGPTEDHYHTLHIGSGKPDTQEVYNATGDAKIYFNIAWSDGVKSADQKTDRLLIHGDVSGSTTVYIKSDSGDESSVVNAADPSNIGGLSLIQVSGKAQEDSFKLENGYTTRNRLPYKYTLTAYGPESSHGTADVAQSLFDEKNENFWDFRLHKEILETDSGSGPSVIVPVAQTASYLVMPNALFYSGLTDMAKQNALLANIRTSVLGKEEEKQTGFFLYTYGNTGTLSSERGPLKYGYGADIRYAALQAGVTFAALEGQNTTTHFGLVGTYGRLSFTPKDMDDVSKSTLDKWSLTAYGSVQHNNGFYMDTLLSYGILKGDIGNAIIGKTAKLQNAKMLSISTTFGKEFATGMESLTFEPQAQIAYQHLMFNTIEDADNFTVDMNNPSQWLIRVGGRLTKTISTENNRPMSFYGKVNLIKTFGDNGTIQIGRDFDLDPMGPAIEGGVGINAQLSHNFSLHGDVSYQQKLQKTGISGANFSGGIRYQF